MPEDNDDGSILQPDWRGGVRVVHARAMELEDQVEKLIVAGDDLWDAGDNIECDDASALHEAMDAWRKLVSVLRS